MEKREIVNPVNQSSVVARFGEKNDDLVRLFLQKNSPSKYRSREQVADERVTPPVAKSSRENDVEQNDISLEWEIKVIEKEDNTMPLNPTHKNSLQETVVPQPENNILDKTVATVPEIE